MISREAVDERGLRVLITHEWFLSPRRLKTGRDRLVPCAFHELIAIVIQSLPVINRENVHERLHPQVLVFCHLVYRCGDRADSLDDYCLFFLWSDIPALRGFVNDRILNDRSNDSWGFVQDDSGTLRRFLLS